MENEENTEEKQKDVEAEEEETRERMVLKTDSGTEVDLAKLKSAADVAPEMGGYLKKLQHQLSILLGGGRRSSVWGWWSSVYDISLFLAKRDITSSRK